MKRILLPTDFSENAYNAISYAVQLYKDVRCTFFILNTYTPASISAGSMMDSSSALSLQEVEKNASKQKLTTLQEKVEAAFHNANHTFTSLSSFNLLVPEMKEVVTENDIDLIIMGTKGATGAKEIFLGTNTMYAIKKMKCPVLAVPSGFQYETPKEILFPTDYKLNKQNKYLPLVKEICNEHNSRLHILNAYYNTPLSDKQEHTKEFLDSLFIENVHLFHITEGQDLIDTIESFERKHKINFLVMIHNKHTLFENLLFKPVINQMVFHTDVPFLVIPSVDRQ